MAVKLAVRVSSLERLSWPTFTTGERASDPASWEVVQSGLAVKAIRLSR